MFCKITKEKIKPFMSFGKMPIANGFISKNNMKREFSFEMEVGFSKKLSLFQLNDHPAPKQMFNQNYPFSYIDPKYGSSKINNPLFVNKLSTPLIKSFKSGI